MTRYADPQRCPDCTSPIEYGSGRCSTCGLPLHGLLAQQLFTTLSRADELLTSLRASAQAPAPAPVPAPTVEPTPARLPATPLPQPAAMKGSSVPKILLTLGAGCLLVAALVFLAVAWSVMGVGGRTATLVGITGLAGVLTSVVAKRGLRGGVEALGLVTLGLGTLDVFGAENAGWLGDIESSSFAVLLGVLLAGAASASCLALRRTPSGAFTSGEVAAAIGVATVAAGLTAGDWWSLEGRLVVATLVALGAVLVGDRLRLVVTAVGAGVVASLSWLALALAGYVRLVDHPTLAGVWRDLEAWPALAAAALAAAVVAIPRLPLPARQLAASVAAALATLVVVAPVSDEAATPQALVVVAVLAAAAGVLWFVPKPWNATAGLTLLVSGLGAAAGTLALGALGATRLLEAGIDPGLFADRLPARPDTDVQPWILLLAVAALCFATASVLRYDGRQLPWQRILPTVGVSTAIATAALYPLPIWLFVAAALAAGVAFALRGQLVATALLLPVAVFVGLHSDGLTAVALATVVVTGAWVHLRDEREEVRETAALLAQLALAGSVWTAGDLLDRPAAWVAAVGIVVVALAPLLRRSVGLEVGAAVGFVGLFAAGVETSTWAAIDLTLAGVATCVHALLREDRRRLGWVGGLLLAAATWVRLADIGVEEPEPYTLPSALALLAVGLLHLRRRPSASTMEALGAGLSLALVPSLLWVIAEPATMRAALLGIACLAVVVAGVQLRWSAPLIVAGSVGALVVLRHAAPYVADSSVPRWVLIGFAGVLLVAMGVTWEQRVREARAMLGYVRGLR